MISLLLAAVSFAIVVNQNATQVRLYFPQDANVTLLEVCVISEGHNDADKGESPDPWYQRSCWPPSGRYTETYVLRRNTYLVRGRLVFVEDGMRFTFQTPVIRVRPE